MRFNLRQANSGNLATIALGLCVAFLIAGQAAAQDSKNDTADKPEQSGPQPPPLVQVSPYLDLGFVVPDGYSQGVVTIMNDSEETIQILNAKGDCHCTTPVIQQMILEPGQSTDMVVGLNAPHLLGRIFKKVFITAAGYNTPFEVPFTAEVEHAILVNGGEGRSVIVDLSGSYKLESINKEPFRILFINGKKLTADDFANFDPESDDPRNFYEIQYDYTDLRKDELPRWIVIETDRPNTKMFEFPAFFKEALKFPHSENWWPVPDVLVNPSIEAGAWTPMEIVMSGNLPKPGDSVGITPSNPDLAVRIKNVGLPDTGPGMRIDFEVKPRWGYEGFISSALNFEMGENYAVVEFFSRVRPYEGGADAPAVNGLLEPKPR